MPLLASFQSYSQKFLKSPSIMVIQSQMTQTFSSNVPSPKRSYCTKKEWISMGDAFGSKFKPLSPMLRCVHGQHVQRVTQQRDRSHHHRHSIFENLNYFDLVLDVPLDAMHLFDFGLMKRMFDYLMRTKYPIPNVSLSPAILRQFNVSFQSLKPFISRLDFARQPRTIKELPRWKSAEFRQVLLYTGVVIFKKYLSSDFY